jgi:hypothetical protein
MAQTFRKIRVLGLFSLLCALCSVAKADTVVYTDGPTNGTVSGWTINSGFSVQNSFTVSSSSTLTSVTFGNWLSSGDSATSVDWSIVTSEGGSTLACSGCSGTGSLTEVTTPYSNGLGFDIVDQNFSLGDISLDSGTYWLQLSNLVISNGDPGYWDMNGGPSQVWESSLGDVSGSNCTTQQDQPAGSCSDAFTIYGSGGATPEPNSVALLGSGFAMIGGVLYRRRRVA